MEESQLTLIDDIILEDIEAQEGLMEEIKEDAETFTTDNSKNVLGVSDGQMVEVQFDTDAKVDFSEFVSQNTKLITRINSEATITLDESRGTMDWLEDTASFSIGDEEFVFPIWSIIVIAIVAILCIVAICYARKVSNQNKKANEEQLNKLRLEVQMCEDQGIDLPDDLRSRVEGLSLSKSNRVQPYDDLKDGKGKGGNGKSGKMTRYNPMDQTDPKS